MIVIAALEAVALVVVVFLLLRHLDAQEVRWALERRELLTRIQHPEVVPHELVQRIEVPEPEPDYSHKVGTIDWDDSYLED